MSSEKRLRFREMTTITPVGQNIQNFQVPGVIEPQLSGVIKPQKSGVIATPLYFKPKMLDYVLYGEVGKVAVRGLELK